MSDRRRLSPLSQRFTDARLRILAALYAAGHDEFVHIYADGEFAFMRDVGPRHDPQVTDLGLLEADWPRLEQRMTMACC